MAVSLQVIFVPVLQNLPAIAHSSRPFRKTVLLLAAPKATFHVHWRAHSLADAVFVDLNPLNNLISLLRQIAFINVRQVHEGLQKEAGEEGELRPLIWHGRIHKDLIILATLILISGVPNEQGQHRHQQPEIERSDRQRGH